RIVLARARRRRERGSGPRKSRGVGMSGFTRISRLLWNWEPMTLLDPTAIKLWLVVYTDKKYSPGLCNGHLVSIVADAGLPVVDADQALDRHMSHDLAMYDHRTQVLRLTRFPDAGEFPQSPFVLKGWWSRFLQVPQCPVRDSHVPLLRWVLEKGAAE